MSSPSLLSRYPALARASRLLDGPPPCRAHTHDLFDLGVACSRLYARASVRQDQPESSSVRMGDDASMVNRQDDLDKRGVSGD